MQGHVHLALGSLRAGGRDVGEASAVDACPRLVKVRVDKLRLVKLNDLSVLLPVQVSGVEWFLVLVWDDMVEHITNSVEVAVGDAWSSQSSACILVSGQICGESMLANVVVHVLDVAFEVSEESSSVVHNILNYVRVHSA